MTATPRVVLLMHPFAGYDRGLLEGIARYVQLHGPWVFCLAGEHRGIPMPETDSTNDKLFPVERVRWRAHGESFPFAVWTPRGSSPGFRRRPSPERCCRPACR